MILVAAVALIALIYIYRANQDSKGSQERFNATLQPLGGDDGGDDEEYPQRSYSAIGQQEDFTATQTQTQQLPKLSSPATQAAGVLPSEASSNEQYRAVDYPPAGPPSASVYPSKRLTTEDLLPKDAVNTRWAQVTPSGQGELRDLNFMTAGWHIGVDTQGQSLKNPNLQLRSEPLNPQYKVSPWNMSTVEPDTSRRPFELI